MEYETAIKLYKEVEEVQFKTLGPTHQNYLTTKRNLATCYLEMYEYENITESDVEFEGVSSEEDEWCEIAFDMLEE